MEMIIHCGSSTSKRNRLKPVVDNMRKVSRINVHKMNTQDVAFGAPWKRGTTRGFFRFVGSGTDDLFRIEELEVQINFPLTDVLFGRFVVPIRAPHSWETWFLCDTSSKRAKRLNSLLRSVVVLHPSHQTVNCLGSHLF